MDQQMMTPEMSTLKTRLKATWESGDYGVFARYLAKSALDFFDRLNIAAGTRLLDVAWGAGQLTIPAAKRGIDVTGLDLAANLVKQAQARAAAEGLVIPIEEGDAESLPFPDSSFDVVLSLIGSMFAPRPERVASEMIRVCKPGGRIIMDNWTPAGHVGQMFKVISKHVPPPHFPSPLLWGDESTVRQRLGFGVKDLTITRHMDEFVYPFSPTKVDEFFNEDYGPTNQAYGSLDEVARETFHDDLTALWSANNLATDGTAHVRGEHIQVIGTRT
ncbi:MAG: class I SAM-dependent methyltransferase [Vicinamibacterales bacterium]